MKKQLSNFFAWASAFFLVLSLLCDGYSAEEMKEVATRLLIVAREAAKR